MIDAYEIGIQLALQDGVSAGLAVIGRELTEVDRAVAATSAGLMGLTRTAEGAVRSAAVAGVRTPAAQAVPTAEPASRTEAVTVASKAPEPAVPPAAVATVAPVSPGAAAPAPAAQPVVLAEGGRDVSRAPARVTREEAASRPPRDVASGPQVVVQQSFAAQAAPVAAGREQGAKPGAPMREAPVVRVIERNSTVQRRETAPERAAAVVQAGPRGRNDAAGPVAASLMPMRAAVAQAVPPGGGRVAGAVGARSPGSGVPGLPAMGMPVAAAPGMAGPPAAAVPAGSRFVERAAAPQPEAPETGQSGGGSVMLDGRLVGYWLTERMAREASRPPGGTSFFDPRQAPAWTPSGAL